MASSPTRRFFTSCWVSVDQLAAEVADEDAHHGALIDAFVIEEAPVLGGNECALDQGWNVAQRQPDASVARLIGLRETRAVDVENDAPARKSHAFQFVVVGQIGHRLVVIGDDLVEIGRRFVDRLARAELPVQGMQVGKVEPAKRLIVSRDALGIAQRCLDQLVDIDILDVEGPAHVLAPILQQRDRFGPITARIEFGAYRVLAGHDLAESQSGGQDLDQNCVHAKPITTALARFLAKHQFFEQPARKDEADPATRGKPAGNRLQVHP